MNRTFLTPQQTFELGRLADRCGPVAVSPHSSGTVVVEFATAAERAYADFEVALDDRGRVVAHRRLPRAAT